MPVGGRRADRLALGKHGVHVRDGHAVVDRVDRLGPEDVHHPRQPAAHVRDRSFVVHAPRVAGHEVGGGHRERRRGRGPGGCADPGSVGRLVDTAANLLDDERALALDALGRPADGVWPEAVDVLGIAVPREAQAPLAVAQAREVPGERSRHQRGPRVSGLSTLHWSDSLCCRARGCWRHPPRRRSVGVAPKHCRVRTYRPLRPRMSCAPGSNASLRGRPRRRDGLSGAKALRKAIRDVFGEHALVHRCHRHKERNVCDLLPERDRDQVRARMRAAWALTDPGLARDRLELLTAELDRTWPDAAGSLREGLQDTLTLMRLGITGQLAKTLSSTNPCESMIEIVRRTQRNVKRWQDGDMRKRWTAAGMLVAEQQFRRIIGYHDLATLVIAVERHALRAAADHPDRHESSEPVTV